MFNFNVVYYHFKHRDDYQPIIRCSELLGAIAPAKGINKIRSIVENAFPTVDMRKVPIGAPAFRDLHLTVPNATSLLNGLGTALKDDPSALSRLPKIIAKLEALAQQAQELQAVPA